MKKQILTREQAIEKTLEYANIPNWDKDTMQLFIEEYLVSLYEKMTDKELNRELANEWANNKKCYESNACPFIIDESPTAKVLYG